MPESEVGLYHVILASCITMCNAKNSDNSVAAIKKKMPPYSQRRRTHCWDAQKLTAKTRTGVNSMATVS